MLHKTVRRCASAPKAHEKAVADPVGAAAFLSRRAPTREQQLSAAPSKSQLEHGAAAQRHCNSCASAHSRDEHRLASSHLRVARVDLRRSRGSSRGATCGDVPVILDELEWREPSSQWARAIGMMSTRDRRRSRPDRHRLGESELSPSASRLWRDRYGLWPTRLARRDVCASRRSL